jgi:hypothetical protein
MPMILTNLGAVLALALFVGVMAVLAVTSWLAGRRTAREQGREVTSRARRGSRTGGQGSWLRQAPAADREMNYTG